MAEISVDEIKLEAEIAEDHDIDSACICMPTSETASNDCELQPNDSSTCGWEEVNGSKNDLNSSEMDEDEDEGKFHVLTNMSYSSVGITNDVTSNGGTVENFSDEQPELEIIGEFRIPSVEKPEIEIIGNYKTSTGTKIASARSRNVEKPEIQYIGNCKAPPGQQVIHVVQTNVNVPFLSRLVTLPQTNIGVKPQQPTNITLPQTNIVAKPTNVTSTNVLTSIGSVKPAKPQPVANRWPKRKRFNFVDEYTVMCNARMKDQLSDTSDIVTGMDIAPATKRLMHVKETTGVERLFARPGRTLRSVSLFKMYLQCLTTTAEGNEEFNFESYFDEKYNS